MQLSWSKVWQWELSQDASLHLQYSDVKEYSTGACVKDVQLEKEEDIEYCSGHRQDQQL